MKLDYRRWMLCMEGEGWGNEGGGGGFCLSS